MDKSIITITYSDGSYTSTTVNEGAADQVMTFIREFPTDVYDTEGHFMFSQGGSPTAS